MNLDQVGDSETQFAELGSAIGYTERTSPWLLHGIDLVE